MLFVKRNIIDEETAGHETYVFVYNVCQLQTTHTCLNKHKHTQCFQSSGTILYKRNHKHYT